MFTNDLRFDATVYTRTHPQGEYLGAFYARTERIALDKAKHHAMDCYELSELVKVEVKQQNGCHQ